MKKKHKAKSSSYHIRNKIIPSMLAALSIAIIVFIFGVINFDARYGIGVSAVLFSSFASSAFILFLVPKSDAAKISKFVKSYMIGGFIGYLGILVITFTSMPLYVVTAIFIFITIMIMVITRSEHPPGVAIAFAFILYQLDFFGIIIVILGVLMLIFVKMVLEKIVFIFEEDVNRIEHRNKR